MPNSTETEQSIDIGKLKALRQITAGGFSEDVYYEPGEFLVRRGICIG